MLRVLPDTFRRPESFDLAEHWRVSSGDFERSLRRFRCSLRLSPLGLGRLATAVDPVAAAEAIEGAGPADADGWREVTLEGESEAVVLDQLSTLGAEVQVLEPPQLRAALADVGREMTARNRP